MIFEQRVYTHHGVQWIWCLLPGIIHKNKALLYTHIATWVKMKMGSNLSTLQRPRATNTHTHTHILDLHYTLNKHKGQSRTVLQYSSIVMSRQACMPRTQVTSQPRKWTSPHLPSPQSSVSPNPKMAGCPDHHLEAPVLD